MGTKVAGALCLAVLAWAGPSAAGPADPVPPAVIAVELHVPPGVDTSELPNLVSVRKGAPLSRRAVRESIARLWASDRFADVVVRSLPEGGGIRVVFELAPKRCIEGLSVELEGPGAGGEHVLDAARVIAASGLAKRDGATRCPEGAEYYAERLQHAVEGVRAAYRTRGYDFAQASLDLYEQNGGRGLEVVIRVKEGSPTRIAGVAVSGDPGFALARVLEEAQLSVGRILDRDELDKGVDRLKDALRRERYYRARVGDPVVDLRNTASEAGADAIVSLPISAGPRFRFRFDGNRSFRGEVLRRVLNYDGTEPLDAAVIARLQRRLLGFYRYRGFADAVVTSRELSGEGRGEAVLSFEIDEGAPLYVEDITFLGNHPATGGLSSDDLREIVWSHVRARAPELSGEVPLTDDPLALEGRRASGSGGAPVPEASSAFVEEAYREAAAAITELYRDRGYREAKVQLSSAELDVRRHRAQVRFDVKEGPLATVRMLSLHGVPPDVKMKEVEARLQDVGIRVTRPLSDARVDKGRQALAQELTRRGYLFSEVRTDVSAPDGGRCCYVAYEVTPGPQVRVGEILIRGLDPEKKKALRANLAFREGDVLDPESLFESQRNLVRVGAYRQVTIQMLDSDGEAEIKDVEVAVRERARYSGEISGGMSLAEGPRFGLDLTAPNLRDSGVNFSAHGRVNYYGASATALFPTWCAASSSPGCFSPQDSTGLDGLGGRGNLTLDLPRLNLLLPAEIGARLDAVAERLYRPFYRFTRFAGIAGLSWQAPQLGSSGVSWALPAGWARLGLQGELEHDRVWFPTGVSEIIDAQDTGPAYLNERFPEGNFSLWNVRSSATLDFRKEPANPNPTSGIVLSGTGELTGQLAPATRTNHGTNADAPLPGFNTFTFKAAGNVTFYLPVAPKVVLAVSAQAGRIFPLAKDSVTIVPKRFFLGGFATMRGFREDGLVPQDRRDEIRREIAACQATINRGGCAAEAVNALAGGQSISEGGELFALTKAELRFPVFGSFDLGVFGEVGNLWLDPNGVDWHSPDLRYVAGVGLRYGTPIGPVALDVGFNLTPDRQLNEQTANLHFSIGLF